MTRKDQPLSRIERKLAGSVHRTARTVDGRDVLIRAYPSGIPPRRKHLVALTPYYFGVLRDAFRFQRYHFKFRGAWVVEVRESEIDRLVVDRTVAGRGAAMGAVEHAQRVVPTIRYEHVDPDAFNTRAKS